MSESIRTFIAIELDDTHHRALSDLQRRFKRECAERAVRWVTPENVHLTLKFLGEVDAGRMPALQHAVSDACAGIVPFTLAIAGAGAFPNTRHPNVIWVGVAGEIERAAVLAERIDERCVQLGFARDEHPFLPHLTLGRVKRDTSPADRRTIGEMIANAQVGTLGELRTQRISVMKSELRSGSRLYTRLAEIPLTND